MGSHSKCAGWLVHYQKKSSKCLIAAILLEAFVSFLPTGKQPKLETFSILLSLDLYLCFVPTTVGINTSALPLQSVGHPDPLVYTRLDGQIMSLWTGMMRWWWNSWSFQNAKSCSLYVYIYILYLIYIIYSSIHIPNCHLNCAYESIHHTSLKTTRPGQPCRAHPRSLTASLPLKNDGWKTILSYWEGNFSGANC